MGDQNRRAAEEEVLSPSELFTARSRNHKIPPRGQKDFFPDDSERQRQRLKQSLDEHWSLVSEERVERLGNLVQAVWIPRERRVELQPPAGRFWQTMGFSANGKPYLLPEEALYLMECGNLQMFYHGLPLSIQEGYESFLCPKTLPLQQYQVFGHLKRLGYVVHRFDTSTVPSSREDQPHPPPSNHRARNNQKRKLGDSPSPMLSHTEAEEESLCDTESRANPPTHETSETLNVLPTDPSQYPCRGWWWATSVNASTEAGPPEPADQSSRATSSSPHWDFHSVSFPDLGSWGSSSRRLPSPDPSLLPGPLAVGDCDVACWLRRLNPREVRMFAGGRYRRHVNEDREEVRMSAGDRYRRHVNEDREGDRYRRHVNEDREEVRMSAGDRYRRHVNEDREGDRYRRHVNEDREARRCSNWTEYHQLQERRIRGRHGNRPPHLWEGSVVPLHDPNRYIQTAELLERISVVKSSNLLDGASGLTGDTEWRLCFSVYQPDVAAGFKKSNPGKPCFRLCVCSFQGPVPDLQAVKALAFQSGDVPVTFAVVDHGDISFYTFKDFHLPTDVFP